MILCLAIVISSWLLLRQAPESSAIASKSSVSSVKTNSNTAAATNGDWKKLLTTVSSANDTYLNLTQGNTETPDDTTLTAQMSRDFMSQYLLMKQGGRTLTQDDINTIVNNVLASPQYTKTTGAVYIASNLNVVDRSDTDTYKKYRNAFNLSLKNRSAQVSGDPITIMQTAVLNEDPSEMAKLDPIIAVNKAIIGDFLTMEVPKDAVTFHLAILNSFSNILANLQAMRISMDDPIRGLVESSSFNKNMQSFVTNLGNMNAFLKLKLGNS